MIKSIHTDKMLSQTFVRHAFYSRNGGVSSGSYSSLNCSITNDDDISNVIENRKRVANDFDVLESNLLSCKQIHSSKIIEVSDIWDLENSPQADGMVTNARGIALGVLSADCVPVLLSDFKSGVVGAVHAGWRGALDGVVQNAIESMVKLGAEKENIVAALGPSIWQDSYEIDLGVMLKFTDKDVNNRRFFIESDKDSHYMFDLPAFVRAGAMSCGIEDCVLSSYDTYVQEDDYFSCRRNAHKNIDKYGAQISLIMLTES